VPRKPDRTVLDLAAKALNVATTTTFVENSLNPVDKPFWADLPHTDIFQCLTPDLLHQLHRGVFKDHLLKWCQTILTNEEIDQRFRAQAHHPTLKHFNNGVSSLSQTTGKEHKNMEKVFVGVIHGGADPHLVRAAVGMIDFIYLASLPIHTEESISALEGALKRFHDDKQIFVQLGGRELEHFELNKLHALMHYAELIRSRGALDDYNTEWSERLHIDFAKKGYRASNHINYMPQMAQWLSRREKVVFYRHYLEHMGAITPQGYREPGVYEEVEPTLDAASLVSYSNSSDFGEAVASNGMTMTVYRTARSPARANCSISALINSFGCSSFVSLTNDFLHSQGSCSLSLAESDCFDVYTRLHIQPPPASDCNMFSLPEETIRANPRASSDGVSNTFDTVLVHREVEDTWQPVLTRMSFRVCYCSFLLTPIF
jgi:hypothetical protein